MKSHPSGRPRKQTKRGYSSCVRWPREDFVTPRLNHPQRDLAGGFGFRCPAEPDDDMWFETRGRKR